MAAQSTRPTHGAPALAKQVLDGMKNGANSWRSKVTAKPQSLHAVLAEEAKGMEAHQRLRRRLRATRGTDVGAA